MDRLTFDYSKIQDFVLPKEIEAIGPLVGQAHEQLHRKTGPGKEFLGWLDWPETMDPALTDRIKHTAGQIQANSDTLVVVGIGGSYLGARAALEMLRPVFPSKKVARNTPEIYFAGHHLSGDYLAQLLAFLEDREVSINVISKSGTTTEPAIAFRLLKDLMERKYGKAQAAKRIIATTDQSRGALKALADQEGYQTFAIPDDIGGRYSVLTPVGLLPMAVGGIDIESVLQGAQEASAVYGLWNGAEIEANACYLYGAIRNLLYQQGKTLELLVGYDPRLTYLGEWWKQLFGESEGKEGKGIFPAYAGFTTDLHSLGQYIQEGRKSFFETVLHVKKSGPPLLIQADEQDLDGLNYLAGKDLDHVNQKAFEGTLLAHQAGGVPNLVISLPELSSFYFGYLTYFFQKACGISGYLLGVNPFDQPGVEAYKRNMFALLGKKGYEAERENLLKGMV